MSQNVDIVLASASPRRKDILEKLDINFTVHPSSVDENRFNCEDPVDLTLILAEKKAVQVSKEYPSSIIIAADTVVACDDNILEKPASRSDARDMLETLRGSHHRVITGLCVIYRQDEKFLQADTTHVEMRKFTDGELEGYLNSGEPMGKAGAYAIQGLGGLLVKKIEGSYFTVVGLPLHVLEDTLLEVGAELL